MLRLSLLLLLTLACGGGPDGGSGKGGQGGGDPEEDGEAPVIDTRALVEVATVGRGAVADHLEAAAAVESESQATVMPETQGVVTGLYVEEGDVVTAGQLLAEIASPTLDAAWSRASAELARAQADLVAAERLFGEGALSKTERDLAKRAVDLAKTGVEEASRTRGFTRLRSPIAGTVATRNLRKGELAGGQPAFVIVDPDDLRVIVNLPERELSRVRPGQTATLTSAWDPKLGATATVLRVAPVVDPATGTFRTTLSLSTAENKLRPGQYARVAIEVDRHEDVLTAPQRAVVWEDERPYVFVMTTGDEEPPVIEGEKPAEEKKEGEGEGKEKKAGEEAPFWEKWFAPEEPEKPPEPPGPKRVVTRVPVTLGYQDGKNVEIVSGVEEGRTVVVVGNEALKDHAVVRLPEDPVLKPEKKDGEKEEDGKEAGKTPDEGAGEASSG